MAQLSLNVMNGHALLGQIERQRAAQTMWMHALVDAGALTESRQRRFHIPRTHRRATLVGFVRGESGVSAVDPVGEIEAQCDAGDATCRGS